MKKKTPAKLKKDLWKLFSEYIRRKDADSEGYAVCFTCGRRNHWKMMHAGHYIRASAGLSTYFDEQNVHVQDYACNIWRDGNSDVYALKLQEKYGEGILKELQRRKNLIVNNFPFEKLIAEYKEKLTSL